MMRIRMLALGAVLLLGAACGGGGEPSQPAGGPTATTGPTGATGTTDDGGGYDRYGGGGGGMGDGGGQNKGDVALQAVNFSFSPADLEVASGTELVVRNAATDTPHTFTVEDTDVDVELSPGDVEDVEIDLDAGTYAFHCRFHSQMTGTLTVT
jgi:plastocyanin